MTVTVRHGDLGAAVTDISAAVRLPSASSEAVQAPVWSLTESAEKGSPAMAGLTIEDPAAAVTVVGMKECHVEDSACTEPTIFAGFWDDRNVSRAGALRTGSEREWDASTVDCNVLLGDIIIDAGIRPAETDIARIDWLLASGYLPIGDAGFIDRSSPTALPKADYTGRYAADVLAECSNASNKNYFVRWEQAAFFPDVTSPWAPTPDVYSQTFYAPTAYGFMDQSLANGTRRMITVVYTNSGHALGLIKWQKGLAHTAGCPWLDPTGVRLSDTILSGHHFAGGSANLGICTLDADVSDQAWTCRTETDIGYGSGTWAYGWYQGASWPYYDPADFSTTTVNLYPPGPGPALGYHETGWASDSAGIAVSNVLADLGATTFPPKPEDKLTRSPARVYSGCWFEYNGGHVYRTSPGTLASFRKREVRSSDMNCATAAAATVLADAYLVRCATEEDRITVNLEAVPASKVNLARPGQRIAVKLSHVPGYETGAYMSIVRRTVTPDAYGLYSVSLDLADPKLTGFHPADSLAPSLWQNTGNVVAPAPIDLTYALPGQVVTPVLVGTGDGFTTLFALGSGYLPGSVRVWVDGQPVPQTSITETSPTGGTITLDFSPAGAVGSVSAQAVVASWQVD